MDISKYRERRTAGTVSIQKLGTQYVLLVRSFDPLTGQELPSSHNNLDVEAIKRRREEIVEQINEIDALLSDVRNLDTQHPTPNVPLDAEAKSRA